MAIMSIAVQNLLDPLGVQNSGVPNRLRTGPLVWSRTGLDVAAQLPAWRGVPAATRGDARPKFDP